MHYFDVARFDSFARWPGEQSFLFSAPAGAVKARAPAEVGPLLESVEAAIDQGLHAVGYMSYEAASALDERLLTCQPGALPLAHFCFYREKCAIAAGEGLPKDCGDTLDWQPSLARSDYDEAIGAVRAHLAAGDSYQVNYTFRLRAQFEGDAGALYGALGRAQQAPFAAYLDDGEHAVISASPELFFRLRDGVLETRPMKGTRRRGRWSDEDLCMAEELRQSAKERAENVMITDMVRNDLGRISKVGSVEVPTLFCAERYPTLWQLTSTVRSRLRPDVGLAELLAALFPCASVTGAPKVRTMEIIRALEGGPRGIYTGCIGFVSPGPEACFNVAIRTAHWERARGALEYGVGGGITWDSSAQGEYDECLVKAQVLSTRRPTFDLLETLLWDGASYYLLERHLQRLADSAAYWGYECDLDIVKKYLSDVAKLFGSNSMRVRMLLAENGSVALEHSALEPPRAGPMRARLAREPVDSADPFLYHKTTHRVVYERAVADGPKGEEVLLFNERGEMTEFCIGNLVVHMGDERWTPPIASGLLPGTLRAELLAGGQIAEKTLTIEDLERAENIFLINSVRRFVPIECNLGGRYVPHRRS